MRIVLPLVALTLFGGSLGACSSSTEKPGADEEIIAEFEYSPDDDKTDEDGNLVRVGTATVYPGGKEKAEYSDTLEFRAVLPPANTEADASITLTDPNDTQTRVFTIAPGGNRFSLSDGQDDKVEYTVGADGRLSMGGKTFADAKEAVTSALATSTAYANTTKETFTLVKAILQQGFASTGRATNVCTSNIDSCVEAPEKVADQSEELARRGTGEMRGGG